jgi:hypothetical protein
MKQEVPQDLSLVADKSWGTYFFWHTVLRAFSENTRYGVVRVKDGTVTEPPNSFVA